MQYDDFLLLNGNSRNSKIVEIQNPLEWWHLISKKRCVGYSNSQVSIKNIPKDFLT